MKTQWIRTLAEVLMHDTEPKEMTSPRTGNTYVTDVVPILRVLSTGTWEEVKGQYKYSVVDVTNNLEYSIKAPEKIEVKLGTILQFKNVRGGTTNSGVGWFSADSVIIAPRNK
ncbi:hypothetical protein QP168_07325 [Aerococcus urinae]|uniref:DUF961 domain-containing protein n=1 Tax=Aerococcus mictus TaxID=2976810 RepID=A0A1E9PQP9_9LACT|nr:MULTISPECIES: hypothetical protein [Aerococcus]KAA9289437.1 hypothetical protein F6I06_09320 [Aerococcus mictus]MCY3034991.1 hypothetical protein [Aerococcus mictus]MCY3064417.1 hypothetical protein [Aerococcus mictus]MCY3066129.1 hypothetical protein [Aerococcus mictus]MCY3068172.1 hypothetical protein [Aerococcus mictus]